MTAWLQTLSAVVVGGVLTYVGQLLLDSRRDRRAQEQAERADVKATQANAELTVRASRLVLLDALSVVSHLRSTYETGRWATRIRLPTGAWRAHGPHLSQTFDDTQFRHVGATFSMVENFNALVAASDRYWLFAPTIKLKPGSGLGEMRDELLVSTSDALADLLAIAMPTLEPGDPLRKLVAEIPADAVKASGGTPRARESRPS